MMLTNQSGLARDLGEASGIKTNTLAHFLTRNEGLAATSRAAPVADKADHAGKTLIVDEASMISSRQMQGLFRIADKLGIERIALVGDRKQIPAIEAGRPFALLQDRMGVLILSQNVRQQDPQMREAVALLGAGDIRAAFDLLGSRTVETPNPANTAAEAWLKLNPDQRQVTEIFTSGHRLRDAVLDALKEERGTNRSSITLAVYENLNRTIEEMRHVKSYATGLLLDLINAYRSIGLDRGSYTIVAVDQARQSVTVEQGGKEKVFRPDLLPPNTSGLSLSLPKQVTLHEGDRVMATAKIAKRGIVNGDKFTLKAIEGERLRLTDSRGKAYLVEPGDPLRRRLDHADALNMHRVQGKTAENAITVLSAQDKKLNSQSLAYVLASRAKEGFTLYVDDREQVIRQIETNDGRTPHAVEVAEPASSKEQASP